MSISLKNQLVVLIVGIGVGVLSFSDWSPVWSIRDQDIPGSSDQTESMHQKQLSRMWMEYAEDIVREDKLSPPGSARLYAYVSTAYYETFKQTGSQSEAHTVTKGILDALAPEHIGMTLQIYNGVVPPGSINRLSQVAVQIRDNLLARIETDNYSAMLDEERPIEERNWIGTDPLVPSAKIWKQWVVTDDDDLSVPPPPVWGSKEQVKAIEEVKRATAARTPEQGASVNFWGGTPGTEGPAGIWQNVFYEETKEYSLSDEEYAYAQMVLAQTTADAFIEAWQVKFTYWTRRPSMDDPSILPLMGMRDPNFPSYVSAHSTISRAAAEVLSALFPKKHNIWIANAIEARSSRLWGGIHFPYDNAAGFDLGERIGKVAIERLGVVRTR